MWDEGFTVSVMAEEGNLFEPAALVLKDSMGAQPGLPDQRGGRRPKPSSTRPSARPFPYAMWFKNADPFAEPLP